MSQPINYVTSRDYRELACQMQTRRLVCFVDYDGGGEPVKPALRDVASTRYMPASKYAPYRIQSRGMGYVEGTLEEFIRMRTRERGVHPMTHPADEEP